MWTTIELGEHNFRIYIMPTRYQALETSQVQENGEECCEREEQAACESHSRHKWSQTPTLTPSMCCPDTGTAIPNQPLSSKSGKPGVNLPQQILTESHR